MSNNENNKLFQTFLDTLEEVIVCPYCGNDNQLDPPLPCCGELHAEMAYLDPNNEVIFSTDLNEAFKAWLEKRGEA